MLTRTAALTTLGVAGFLVFCTAALAHGHHHHGPLMQWKPANQAQALAFQEIGQEYAAKIQPIFEKKCFDCHSNRTVYPWYHSIPGVKQYIDHDIRKANRHIDFSKGYPFISRMIPMEDMDSIHDELKDGDMPPWQYRMMHSKTAITDQEKQIIFDWVDQSEARLEKAGF